MFVAGAVLPAFSFSSALANWVVRAFPNVDAGRWQVSEHGGRSPVRSRDGAELSYLNAKREVVAAPNRH